MLALVSLDDEPFMRSSGASALWAPVQFDLIEVETGVCARRVDVIVLEEVAHVRLVVA